LKQNSREYIGYRIEPGMVGRLEKVKRDQLLYMYRDDEEMNKIFFQARIENIRDHSPHISMQEIQKSITPIHFREFLDPDEDYEISLDMHDFFLTPQEYQNLKDATRKEIPSYLLSDFFDTLSRAYYGTEITTYTPSSEWIDFFSHTKNWLTVSDELSRELDRVIQDMKDTRVYAREKTKDFIGVAKQAGIAFDMHTIANIRKHTFSIDPSFPSAFLSFYTTEGNTPISKGNMQHSNMRYYQEDVHKELFYEIYPRFEKWAQEQKQEMYDILEKNYWDVLYRELSRFFVTFNDDALTHWKYVMGEVEKTPDPFSLKELDEVIIAYQEYDTIRENMENAYVRFQKNMKEKEYFDTNFLQKRVQKLSELFPYIHPHDITKMVVEYDQ